MSSAIDGLISGLDTTSIITQLMQLEALPQTAIKTKVSTTNTFVTALQALNTKMSSLGDAATKAATATSWAAVTSTSSAPSVAATASTSATAGTLTFQVDQLATKQSSVGAAVTDLAGFFGGATPATLTLATGAAASPTVSEISMTGVTDLASLASAINNADAGVSATLVKVSATESRLQLTSKATGAAGAFDLYSGSVAAVDLNTGSPATALLGRAAQFAIKSAADAQITLWAGTGAEQAVTSASNTFAGILTGVDFTISRVEADPVTLTVARNNAAMTTLASDLVTNLSTVLSEIASRTATSTTTDSTGRTIITGGVFSADNAIRTLKQSVLTEASAPVNGISPSTMGIVLGKDGTFTFDAAIFSAALAADPAKVQSVISGVAARLEKLSDAQSDPIVGSISLRVKSQQSYVKGLGDQVLNWDNRLELRRLALEKTYSGLEVALGKLNSQSDWLTSQLTSLTGSNK
ncbi:MAG: flagellar filament capping protein FliD [Cellulomonas sp.]